MTDLEKLLIIEQIKLLRARFARYMDTKDWDRMRDTISNDCVFDCTEEAGIDQPWLGAQQIIDNIRAAFANAVTVHHAHMPEIDVLSSHSARAIWAMQDMLRFPGEPTVEIVGSGHYHETYALEQDGKWRLKTYKLTRLRVDVTRHSTSE